MRLWGVHHIGAISRTRSERLGPLVATGPFALVRNPLYVGNIALWVGFALTARLVWLAPVILVLLALEYHAIVRWEERCSSRGWARPTATTPRACRDGSRRFNREQIAAETRLCVSATRGNGVFLARDALQRARDAHRDRARLPAALD